MADSIGSLYAFLFEMLVIIFDWFIYDDCVIVINILFVWEPQKSENQGQMNAMIT